MILLTILLTCMIAPLLLTLMFLISLVVTGGLLIVVLYSLALLVWLIATLLRVTGTSSDPASSHSTEEDDCNEDLSLQGRDGPEVMGFLDLSRTRQKTQLPPTLLLEEGTGYTNRRSRGRAGSKPSTGISASEEKKTNE